MEQLCKRLLNDASLRSLARKLAGDLHEDLIQEVALVICEQNKDISDYFEFWCARTMINMTTKTGSFWRKYSPKQLDFEEVKFINDLEYNPEADEFWNELDDIFDKQEWYKREMLRTYFECGSYRNVELCTGINHVSVYKTVKEAKKIIHDRRDTNIV